MPKKGFLVPTVVFIVCQILILKLAFWQVDRLSWKENIIEALDVVYEQDASKTALSSASWADHDQKEVFFQRGYISGQFTSQEILFLGPRQREGVNGYHVLKAFQLADGENLLVNFGWVPDGLANVQYVTSIFPQGDVQLFGYVRKPERSHFFSPGNVPTQGLWFGYNMRQFEKALSVKFESDVVFYVEQSLDTAQEYPSPFVTKWYPRNEHFQYMVFWFSMSLAFLAIYILAVLRPLFKGK